MVLSFCFLTTFQRKQITRLNDFFAQRGNALRDRFKFQRELAAFASERFSLRTRCRHFSLQPLSFTVCGGQSLLNLPQPVTQILKVLGAIGGGSLRMLLLLLKCGE